MKNKKISIIVSSIAAGVVAMASATAAHAVTVGATGVKVGVQVQASVQIGRADQEIARRIAALNKLSARVQAMQKVTADAKSKIAIEVQAQISDLSALKVKIDADTDATVLHTDVQSITDSYRIFAVVLPQGYILAASDRMEVIAAAMKDLGVKMQARIDAAHAAGHDVSAMTAAMADLNLQLSNTNFKAQSAGTLVYGLTPDQGDQSKAASNHDALVQARDQIRIGTEDLKAARANIQAILKDLKASSAAGAQ
jgi:hypothetical protein